VEKKYIPEEREISMKRSDKIFNLSESFLRFFYSGGTIYSFNEEIEAEKIRIMPDDSNRMFLIKGFEVEYGKKFPIETGINFITTTNIPESHVQFIADNLNFLFFSEADNFLDGQLCLEF
jgi:hypothetical protein